MTDITLAHYRNLNKLGDGGTGAVYEAEDRKYKRSVALKILPGALVDDAEWFAAFRAEADAVAALGHPNIAAIYGIEEAPKAEVATELLPDPSPSGSAVRFLVLELVKGAALDLMTPTGGFELGKFLDLAVPLSEALGVAHQQGIAHGELKPANVKVTPSHQLKLLDLGQAKIRGVEPDPSDTQPVPLLGSQPLGIGTTPYMAPEQIEGRAGDSRGDMFALGVLLQELATGKRPFAGRSAEDVKTAIRSEMPAPVGEVGGQPAPPELVQLIERCLQKDPGERYGSANEVCQVLKGLRAKVKSTQAAQAAAVAEPAPKPKQRVASGSSRKGWLPAAAGGGVVVVLAVLAGWWLLRGEDPSIDPGMGNASSGSRGESVAAPRRGRLPRLAVLPFENLGSPEDQRIAGGVGEEILHGLMSADGVDVIARSSVARYDRGGKTVSLIGKELGVDYVVEGSVQVKPADDGSVWVLVHPSLVRVEDRSRLWSEEIEQSIDGVTEVPRTVVAAVLDQLSLNLPPTGAASPAAVGSEAYEAYLQGLEAGERAATDPEAGQLEVDLLAESVELDPSFGRAWAALGRAQIFSDRLNLYRSPERLEATKTAIDRALYLAPELPEAHAAQGYYSYYGLQDHHAARAAFERAGGAESSRPEVVAGLALLDRHQGRWDEALGGLRRAFELSPRDAGLARELGTTAALMKKHSEARRFYERAIQVAPGQTESYALQAVQSWLVSGDGRQADKLAQRVPMNLKASEHWLWLQHERWSRDYEGMLRRLDAFSDELIVTPVSVQAKAGVLGWVLLQLGHAEESRRAFEVARRELEAEQRARPQDYRIHGALGIVYAHLGRRKHALVTGRRGASLYPVSVDAFHGPQRLLELARIYAVLGDSEDAAKLLEEIVFSRSWYSAEVARVDPLWDSIRHEARFQDLIGP